MQNNSPLDKGRVAVIAEKYPSGQRDQRNQPILKNRYATVGRATLWPAKQDSTLPNVEIELDTLPIGQVGPLKLYVFWDSENHNNPQPLANYPQQGQAQPNYSQSSLPQSPTVVQSPPVQSTSSSHNQQSNSYAQRRG